MCSDTRASIELCRYLRASVELYCHTRASIEFCSYLRANIEVCSGIRARMSDQWSKLTYVLIPMGGGETTSFPVCDLTAALRRDGLTVQCTDSENVSKC